MFDLSPLHHVLNWQVFYIYRMYVGGSHLGRGAGPRFSEGVVSDRRNTPVLTYVTVTHVVAQGQTVQVVP